MEGEVKSKMKNEEITLFVLYLIIIIGAGILIDKDSHSVSDTLIQLAPLIIIKSLLLLTYFNSKKQKKRK
jgi:hypothetical protein